MQPGKKTRADANARATPRYHDAQAVELTVFNGSETPDMGGICSKLPDEVVFALPEVRGTSTSQQDWSYDATTTKTEGANRTTASPAQPTRHDSQKTVPAAPFAPYSVSNSAPEISTVNFSGAKKNVSISTPTKDTACEEAELPQFSATSAYQIDDRIFFTNVIAAGGDDSSSEAIQDNHSFSSESLKMSMRGGITAAELSKPTKTKEKMQIRIPSSFAICGLIALGTIMVVVVAFLPLFLVNRTANEATTTFLLAETMKGVASIARSRAATLPAFVNVIVFHYLYSQNSTTAEANLPDTPYELMQALTNVISRSSPNINFLNFVLNASAADGGLYSFVRYNDSFDGLFAAWASDPGTPPLYQVSVNASGIVNTIPTGKLYDMPSRLANKYGPLQEVVRNWKEHGSSARWLNNSLASSGVYFNYVLPFRVGNFYGYCEAGLPASNIADEAARLIPSLREHGNLIMLDARSNIVINNSWGQETQWYDDVNGTSQLVGLSIYNISNAIMAAGIAAVMKNGGFDKVLEKDNTALVRFDNNKAFLNLTRITDSYGLDFIVGATVLMQDFEKDFTKATNVVIGVSVGVFVLAIVVAIVIANRVSHQLRKMIPELQKASHLKLTKSNTTKKSSFWSRLGSLQFVDELRSLQLSYKKLQDSLREMKSYVPAAMLIPISDNSSGMDDDLADASGSSDGRQYQNTQLNANLINEKLNMFETVSCMMVYIEMRITKDMALFNTVLAATTDRIRTYSGILEVVGQNYILISFGAHSNIGDYAKKGMHFVLDAMRALPDDARDQTVCFVEAGSFKVGTCGTKKRCARVVCGTSHMADVARAMWDINSFVATTSETTNRDDKTMCMPVERLHLPDAVHDITLSELIVLDAGEDTEAYRDDYELYKIGLAKMMAGSYTEALAIFSRVQHDYRSHTTRLKSVCELYRKHKVTTGYCRNVQDPFNVLRCDEDVLGQSASTRAATDAALASASNAANLSTSSGKAAASFELLAADSGAGDFGGHGSHSDRNEADDDGAMDDLMDTARSGSGDDDSDAIFDMPDFMETADVPNDDDVFIGSATDGALPMKLSDHKGNVWHRSNKPIGTGTFSQVYLGLSENGEQVAIKAVARRSRTYDQRKIVHEILSHAQLVNQNVVKLISYGVTDTCIALILEFVPGGSLQQIKEKFGPLPFTVLRRLVTDMCSGLRYLHDSNIVHGDIKPHNMLLGLHGTCKLSDFGTTEQLGAPETQPLDSEDLDVCGTCMYMAPEVARGQKPDMASDIYSLGVSILDLALDRIPYNQQPAKQNQFISALGSGEVFLEIPASELHKELYEVVRDCCKADPKDRPTIFQLTTYSFFL